MKKELEELKEMYANYLAKSNELDSTVTTTAKIEMNKEESKYYYLISIYQIFYNEYIKQEEYNNKLDELKIDINYPTSLPDIFFKCVVEIIDNPYLIKYIELGEVDEYQHYFCFQELFYFDLFNEFNSDKFFDIVNDMIEINENDIKQ